MPYEYVIGSIFLLLFLGCDAPAEQATPVQNPSLLNAKTPQQVEAERRERREYWTDQPLAPGDNRGDYRGIFLAKILPSTPPQAVGKLENPLIDNLDQTDRKAFDEFSTAQQNYVRMILRNHGIPELHVRTAEVGQVGRFPSHYEDTLPTGRSVWVFGLKVNQVIDGQNALVRDRIWLQGFDTSGWHDGEMVADKIDRLICVVGEPKVYTTTSGGSRKVKRFIAIKDVDELNAFANRIFSQNGFRNWHQNDGVVRIAKMLRWRGNQVEFQLPDGRSLATTVDNFNSKEQQRIRAIPPTPLDFEKFRMWRSSNGERIGFAKFFGLAGDAITLEGKDGKKTEVKLAQLSKTDHQYVFGR